MGAPLRLAVASLRRRRLGQTLSLVLVCALAATAVVAGLAARTSSASLLDEAYRRAGQPDLLLYGPEPSALAAVADDPRVVAAGAPVPVFRGFEATVSGSEVGVRVVGVDPDALPTVGRPVLVEGRWWDAAPADGTIEAVVERSMLSEGVVEIGERFRMDGPTDAVEVTVVGAAIELSDCFWPNCDPLRVLLPPATVAALGASEPDALRWMTALRLQDPTTAGQVGTELQRSPGGRVTSAQTWDDTRGDILVIGDVFAALLGGFGAFLLLAACLVVATATSARLVARRRANGMLRAVGFTPRQLVVASLAEHAVIAAVGVVLGWFLGCLLAPMVQAGVAGVLGRSGMDLRAEPLVVALVLIELVVMVSVLLPSVRASREPTAVTIREVPSTTGGGAVPARVARVLGAGPAIVTAVRRTFARPVRAGLAGGTVLVAVVGTILSLGFLSTMTDAVDEPARTGNPWDAYVASRAADPVGIAAVLDATPEVGAWFTEAEAVGHVGDRSFLTRVMGGDPTGYVVREGRGLDGPGDALVGYGFLQATGLAVGDPLQLTVGDQVLDLTISGWYLDTADGGELVQIREEALAEPPERPIWRLVAAAGSTPEGMAAAVSERLPDGVRAVVPNFQDGPIGAVTGATIALALVLAAVAAANLLAVTLASTRERARSLGVLRTVGCTTRQLVAQAAAGTGALGLVAGLLGVPLGAVVYRALADGITGGVGLGPGFATGLELWQLLLLIPAAALLAATAGALATIGAARRPAADLVRWE